MTCIAAVAEKNTVWVGGDLMRAREVDLTPGTNPKVWLRKENGVQWIFGHAGTARIQQICQWELLLPEQIPPEHNLCEFLVQRFIPLLRQAVQKGGQLSIKENIETMDGELIIGIYGRIFEIDAGFDLAELDLPFWALGSGSSEAFGVLYATEIESPKRSPEERIALAIKAAHVRHGDTGEKCQILHT